MKSLVSIVALMAVVSACATTADSPADTAEKSAEAMPAEPVAVEQDIVEIAAGAGTFNTLVAAVQAADLVETLQGDGPFTVFAPTDEAFAALPEGTVEALLADKEKLAAILTYHVVAGSVTSSEVATMTSAMTVNGSTVSIDTTEGVKVGGANVVKADIMAKNGVIHVIDAVMIPEG